MQSTNASDAPVATIDKQHPTSSNNIVNANTANNICLDNNTNSPSINCESYCHNNNINIVHNYEVDVPLDAEPPNTTQLETNGDPTDLFNAHNVSSIPYSTPRVTATYQMTMSNNSLTGFSHIEQKNSDPRCTEHHYDQSNSAPESGNQMASSAPRSVSEGPFLQQREEHGRQQRMSNRNENDEHLYINRSPVIEHNVSGIAQVTDNNDPNISGDGAYSISLANTSPDGSTDNDPCHELTECDCGRVSSASTTILATSVMGQKNTKGDASTSAPSQPTPIQPFRESSVTRTSNANEIGSNNVRVSSPSVSVPIITVVDCSSSSAGSADAKSYESAHNFCEGAKCESQQEFNDHHQSRERVEGQACSPTHMTNNATSSYRSPSPTSMYSQMRYNYVKLEDVPEQEEDEHEEDEQEDEEQEDDEGENAAHYEDEGNETDVDLTHIKQITKTSPSNAFTSRGINLDNEYSQSKQPDSLSPDRQQSRSITISNSNSTDSNMSASFPDSGIGESVASVSNSSFINTSDVDYASARSNKQRRAQSQHQEHFSSYVRDGDSTDCDETLMQCEDIIDFVETPDYLNPSERFVCIESISLPDVVVESTNSSGNSSYASSTAAAGGGTLDANVNTDTAAGVDRDIININGATGNSMGNVHFIPIRVEGGSGRSSPRKQSVDDSVVGSGNATIEIIEDVTELQQTNNSAGKLKQTDVISEKLKKELLEQRTKFNVQLEDAHKNVNNLQMKINEMQMKIESLEQELSTKTWNVERLQGELSAAQRDDEYVRKKLKLLEEEKTDLRHRYSECEEELQEKYDELEVRYNELQEKYQLTQRLAGSLQTQLAQAQTDAEESREEVEKIRVDLEEQIRLLKNALENSENERKICEDKWQREFEMLRTHNMDREESIMKDCEWQLRQVQKQCKDRMDNAENCRTEAMEAVEILEEELESLRREIDDLKIYQAQVKSLRGVVNDQAQSIDVLMKQIETLKNDLTSANESLEEQIESVRKIKFHCDNALIDKDRQMVYRIDEVRNEAAAFWEDKLYTEMTRLKHELESVYVDDRRDELDKLQAEHVEELKALTNRYTANEEELRAELAEVQESLEQKSQEFLELRDKSDKALLETRMHLDRADRDFQKAMCQEEERREALEQAMREEFAAEKEEMEIKFRERLHHVKEEFSKELQINTQELGEQHKKELEKVKAKLIAEKDEAVQELQERHRKIMLNREEKIKEIETRHRHDLKDLKAAYDSEKVALDKRDISNANEIEQLHRKCRCLTNLFEEMRMRYERRDPRPEDLREIAELRTRCESQERDMYLLTDRLREMQNQMNEMQQNNVNAKRTKQIKKPPPKTIPTNCDVIYEENEERESPPPSTNSYATSSQNDDDYTNASKESSKKGDNRLYGKKLIKQNEDDTHMITAM